MKSEKKFLLGFFITSIFLIGILVLFIFRPLINTFLLGLVFAFLFHPAYKAVLRIVKYPRIAAFIICLLFILGVTIPLFFAINVLTVEIVGISNKYTQESVMESFSKLDCPEKSPCLFLKKLSENRVVVNSVHDFVIEFTAKAKSYAGELLITLPSMFLHAFILIFMLYYLLLDGEILIQKVKSYLPISAKHKETIFSEINKVMGGILFGSILIGAMQGFLGGVGFFLFGVKAPLLWGVIMFLLSFIPLLGTGIIWVPASLYIIVDSMASYDVTGIYRGIGLFVYCAIVVASADNLLRPKLVSSRTDLHPVLVLFGVLGGIIVFKGAGVIIGPLILGIFRTLLDMFEKERLLHDKAKS